MSEVMGCGHPFSEIGKDEEGNQVCRVCYKKAMVKKIRQTEIMAEKDWKTKCIVCGQVPTMRATEMCGPCTFGEAETIGGNW